MRRGRLIACGALLLGVTALAGCGGGTENDGDAEAAAPSSEAPEPEPEPETETETEEPEETEEPPSPTPTPTPTTPPPTVSASDIENCRDGECEIAVVEGTAIPLDGTLGVGHVTVNAIDAAAGVDLVALTSGGTTGYLNSQLPDQGSPSTVNDLEILVLEISGEAATIRFSPA
ncbi:hypothetical protein E1265_07770 [Streptomyces sp. 8K308]|uniref:hypothetical protein n=1 Tax=Streptomyces sp. 8K308 TaxID=2530388 RepID=UPI001044CBED|nr:hypothetical protein [Streptomyces sp. 8K308]TDC25161.1 hypothetical protein E1265_07770 [Streptomyces sp. 8K308]